MLDSSPYIPFDCPGLIAVIAPALASYTPRTRAKMKLTTTSLLLPLLPLISAHAEQAVLNSADSDPWAAKYGHMGDLSFTGVTSFAHLPHERCLNKPELGLDVALIGMPFDSAVSFRPGEHIFLGLGMKAYPSVTRCKVWPIWYPKRYAFSLPYLTMYTHTMSFQARGDRLKSEDTPASPNSTRTCLATAS